MFSRSTRRRNYTLYIIIAFTDPRWRLLFFWSSFATIDSYLNGHASAAWPTAKLYRFDWNKKNSEKLLNRNVNFENDCWWMLIVRFSNTSKTVQLSQVYVGLLQALDIFSIYTFSVLSKNGYTSIINRHKIATDCVWIRLPAVFRWVTQMYWNIWTSWFLNLFVTTQSTTRWEKAQ